MQKSENQSCLQENVVFDIYTTENKQPVFQEEVEDIMDIPGTAHEKLVTLSKML